MKEEWEVVAWLENGGSSTVRGYATQQEAEQNMPNVLASTQLIGKVRNVEVLKVDRG